MKKSIAGRIFRAVIIGVCVLMVYWYADSNIINIGSVTGSLFFIGIAFIAAFYDKLSAGMKKLRQSKTARYITNVAAGVLCAAGLYLIVVGCLMTAYAMKPPADNATVIVLGCQVNGDNPSMMLGRRTEAAAEYLEAHPDSRCIVSGGKGSGENISEADCMYRELVGMGIAPERIHKEDRSTNTDENIRFSSEIIKQEGLPDELAIVTDGFHQFRAAMIAEKYGYSCGAVSADTPTFLIATFTTREILAITAEFISP